MFGLSRHELRFSVVISTAHFTQHIYYRVLPPLIPVLAVVLDYPLWQLGLLITLYSIGMGIAQAPMGVLSDRVDRRVLLPMGIVLAGAAYVVFAFAPTLGSPLPTVTVAGHGFEGDYLVMSAAMAVVGAGLAVVHPAGYPMITDNVDPSNKGRVLGFFGASSKLGDATAPAIIAGLILLLGWQQIVLLFGVLGALYGLLLYAVLRTDEFETTPSGLRDARGEGEDAGDVDDGPVEDAGRGDRRTYLYPMVTIYFFFVSSMLSTRALGSFLPAFVVAVYAFAFEVGGVALGAESVANLYFSLLLVSGAAMQLFLGRLVDAYDARRLLLGCMALATAGMVGLATLDLHPLLLVVVIGVLGTGLYGVNPVRDALVSDLSPPEYEGRTFGYIFTAVTLTGAPLPTAIGYLIETAGMREGFLLLAAGPFVAGLCIALLYSDRVYVSGPEARERAGASD